MRPSILINVVVLTVSLISFSLFSQSPLKWYKSANASSGPVCNDKSGNVYVAGSFNDSVSFGNISLIGPGKGNAFVAKFDSSGNVIWAIKFLKIFLMEITEKNGEVFIGGIFATTTTTVGSVTLNNAGGNSPGSATNPGHPCCDLFIAKLGSDGAIKWAKSFGGTGDDYIRRIVVDANKNIYTSGEFSSDSIYFGTFKLKNGRNYLTKFDSTGNTLWSQNTCVVGFGLGLAVDKSGNAFVTSSINFPLLAKYDKNGTAVWTWSVSNYAGCSSVAVDANNNVIVIGSFENSLKLGSITLTGNTNSNPFLAKFDSSGNVLWAKAANGFGANIHTVHSSDQGNIYLAGCLEQPQSQITFDSYTITKPVQNVSAVFVYKMDHEGNVICATSVSDSSSYPYANISVDNWENVFITGNFHKNSITIGTSTVNLNNTQSIYLIKYKCDQQIEFVAENAGNNSSFEIYPNPTSNYITVSSLLPKEMGSRITLMNFSGQSISVKHYSSQLVNDTYSISTLPKGIYFLEMNAGNYRQIRKIVVN